MSRIYELLISVNLDNSLQEMQWIEYCKLNNYRMIKQFNFNSVHNKIRVWYHAQCFSEAFLKCTKIQTQMKQSGFEIIRKEVRFAMSDTVQTCIKPIEDIKLEYAQFWEFEFQVHSTIQTLSNLIGNITGVNLSFNVYSSCKFPTVTIRAYQKSNKEAISVKDKIMTILQNNDISTGKKVTSCLGLYDTNLTITKDWL